MIEMINKKRRIILASVFFLMTLIGLLVTPNYGMPWDELMEIRTLGTNLREYATVFTGEEGEPKESNTGIVFTDMTENPDIDHGQSVYYPLTPALFMDLGVEAPRTLMLIFHAYTFLIFMLGVVGLYFISTHLTGEWKYGLLASLFLYLSPRFFAEGHYNSKDIISMSMIILCFWFFIKMTESRKILYAVLFAVFGAFAANMRMTGVFFFGLAGVLYLITLTVKKEWNKKNFLLGLLSVVTFIGFYFLLTPVAWKDPIAFISYVFARSSNYSDWDGYVFYMGAAQRPVPWHYIPVMIAITTPILLVLLIAVGNLTAIASIARTKVKDVFGGPLKYYLMCLVFTWIFLGYAMIRQPILYDSWRHFYFLNGLMITLAVFCVKKIMDLLKGNFKRIVVGIVALQLLASGLIIAVNNPYELTYFNFFAGSDPAAMYEMDYWNVTQANALMKLIDTVNSDKVISVTAAEWVSADGLMKAYNILPEAYKSRMKVAVGQYGGMNTKAGYLMVSLRAYQHSTDKSIKPEERWVPDVGLENFQSVYKEVVVLNAFGSDFMTIYEIPKVG